MNKQLIEILRLITPMGISIIGFFCMETYYDVKNTSLEVINLRIKMENVDTRLGNIESNMQLKRINGKGDLTRNFVKQKDLLGEE